MKYYVFAPYGRTGSKRIVSLIGRYKFTILDNSYYKENRRVVAKYLNDFEEGDVAHSHLLILPEKLDEWTIVLTQRKSKAEQIMSFEISKNLVDGFNPVKSSLPCSPFSLDENTVKSALKKINQEYKSFYNTMKRAKKNYVTINMEDTLKEISEKLPIKHKEIQNQLDVKYKSNHHYKDIILNYQEVFNWCGEEPKTHLTLTLFDRVSNRNNKGGINGVFR